MGDGLDILIAGGHGQVGQALARAPWPAGVRLHRPTREDLNLADPGALSEAFARSSFDAVINAAAFTAVDAAEAAVGEAFHANALIPARLADATRTAGIPLVHLSTDFVFNGCLDRPYLEDDVCRPLGVYGASKRAGEMAVLSGAPRAVVIRTAWVVSAQGRNFAARILALAGDQQTLRVVADRRGNPTSADDLAEAVAVVTLRLIADPLAPVGLYHCVNAGEASWAELAQELMRLSARRGGPSATVTPTAAADYPQPAVRPAQSRLSCTRLALDYSLSLRPWREAVADIVAEASSQEPRP